LYQCGPQNVEGALAGGIGKDIDFLGRHG
jgi:hypothetical protein